MQVLKLRAICSHCRKEAAFTHRISNEEDIEVKSTDDLGVLPGCLDFLTCAPDWRDPMYVGASGQLI